MPRYLLFEHCNTDRHLLLSFISQVCRSSSPSTKVLNADTSVPLPGLQVIFPEYLQEKFVQSALSYIMCNGEGEYMCRNSQCICKCAEEFPQCNCPVTDLQIMENTLQGMVESWAASYKDFENSGNTTLTHTHT